MRTVRPESSCYQQFDADIAQEVPGEGYWGRSLAELMRAIPSEGGLR